MSWKLHKVKEQSVVCAREQELFKKDEKIAQMVVRFVTEQVRLRFLPSSSCSNETYAPSSLRQSLEIRDPRGRLVGNGSHERPETVTEVRRPPLLPSFRPF
jgi:hypothetical protein